MIDKYNTSSVKYKQKIKKNNEKAYFITVCELNDSIFIRDSWIYKIKYPSIEAGGRELQPSTGFSATCAPSVCLMLLLSLLYL